jgi:hypothetical protein
MWKLLHPSRPVAVNCSLPFDADVPLALKQLIEQFNRHLRFASNTPN